MPLDNVDLKYLRQSLQLAQKGKGKTFPNPLVGCVIVKYGVIIGSGYHHKAGGNHAEINALEDAKESTIGATLYVNLEPCSHHGKTPPCVDAIIKAGIARVICCNLDSNNNVRGDGIQKLKAAGIEVEVGGLARDARKLNEAFFTFHELQRPFIAVKYAASIDGKIATRTRKSKWITDNLAREYARTLRSSYQAILVGSNTVVQDNPHLGTRKKGYTDPLRIILDNTLKTSLTSHVYRDGNVIVFTSKKAANSKLSAFKKRGIEVFVCKSDSVNIREVMVELTKRTIISVYVEGGSTVLGSFNDAKLIDKIYAFLGPLLIGGETAKSAVGGEGADSLSTTLQLQDIHTKMLGDSMLYEASVTHTS